MMTIPSRWLRVHWAGDEILLVTAGFQEGDRGPGMGAVQIPRADGSNRCGL